MHTSPCAVCGVEFQHKKVKSQYCSNHCSAKASYERRRDAGTYVKKHTLCDSECERCSNPFQAGMNRGKKARFCSSTCAALTAGELPRTPEQLARARKAKQCGWCGDTFTAKNAKYCGEACRKDSLALVALAMRGPLRTAVETGDHQAVITEVRSRSTVTTTECWDWRGSIKDGYPLVRFGRKTYLVHRLVLEAKHRGPLGSQAAHHQCANTCCVNPDHLEPATYAANTLEMISRQSYLARIAELEAELEALMPSHPLLQHIRCA